MFRSSLWKFYNWTKKHIRHEDNSPDLPDDIWRLEFTFGKYEMDRLNISKQFLSYTIPQFLQNLNTKKLLKYFSNFFDLVSQKTKKLFYIRYSQTILLDWKMKE